MAHCYIAPDLAATTQGAPVTLPDAEARHARVARLRVGERVRLTDGQGTLGTAEVTVAAKDAFELLLLDRSTVAPPTRRLALAQALAKTDRAELAVQAATELGVDVIVPWQAERSIVRWKGEKASKGVDRWRTISAEAGKQAIRARFPRVLDVHSTAELAALGNDWSIIVLDPWAEASFATAVAASGDRDILLVVGPEGGIVQGELVSLAAHGARAAKLGPEVLRTSTAGLAALAALSAVTGRWA